MVFADHKQFLHITTPKPISINPASQRGSTSKLFNCQDNSVYPWVEALNVIPRGRLIDESQVLDPYMQRSQYPDKKFQACITPITYPSSSIDVQIQRQSMDTSSSLELCQSEEDLHNISSKSSTQKVDSLVKM